MIAPVDFCTRSTVCTGLPLHYPWTGLRWPTTLAAAKARDSRLSDEVWLLMENCWDGDPAVRPGIVDVLPPFEAASGRWVPPTSEAIVGLGLGSSVIARRSPSGGSTYMELVDRS